MFHQRIASDLRKHFSTVGPSPASPTSEAFSASQRASTRLVLLPTPKALPTTFPGSLPQSPPEPASLKPRSTARDRQHLLKEFVKVSSHRVAAFLAEAAVLVLVLGILDRFLASNRLDLHWVGGAFLISTVLLASSIALELTARLWLTRP